ncbi:MAG: FAD/FMN-containing dehydrogenase/Fe-S oxidoreductase [Neolewinella sp.]|jgi:FAD/FMN-containing dehydrogenase/Fe-S oxidoreductase
MLLISPPWTDLAAALSGKLQTDEAHRILYATDASVYRELPLAVAFPRSEADVVACIRFAAKHKIAVTPRAGGTSLAGQAIGAGLVVDVSKYLTKILEINIQENYVVVEPGVIRDQLNAALAPLGYWFGPNTSTANRCTLGGMFGNNSCGSTSITVGSTREHVRGARIVLADASVHDLEAGTQVQRKVLKAQKPNGRLIRIQSHLANLLGDENNRRRIKYAFPKETVSRRNTGYALDLLASQNGPNYNLLPLLAGSEGTLAFTTRLKLNILPLPPKGRVVAAVHFETIDAAMRATQVAMRHQPFMCELMDDTILRLARTNPEQAKNADFVWEDPRALLLVEFRADTDEAACEFADKMDAELGATPSLTGTITATTMLLGAEKADQAWNLRAAGLGILGNIIGDAKAVACIEDTAVAIEDLADYINEVEALMHLYQQNPVYYAHAGAGEIHLRPVLNLKTTAGREDFFNITRDVAALVKKYRGSLSGEHGDGRVRAPFLPDMLGPEVYQMLVDLKHAFDPDNLLNPGKIVEAPPMNEGLRYEADAATPDYPTLLDWSSDGGFLRAAEKCNGSGDCRKLSGGAMCPSYRALHSEQHSTRGRANTLREVLTRNQHDDPFAHPALHEALDLCLSCKACTSECPSSVDMTNLKAEYLHQRGKRSLRTRLIAANEVLYGIGGRVPKLANLGLQLAGPLMKRLVGIASERSLPEFPAQSLRSWHARRPGQATQKSANELNLFGDEFTNLQDVQVGEATIQLLEKLGYQINWPKHATSGRAHLSKGLLMEAKDRAAKNVDTFAPLVSTDKPLVGIEPSAILSFRDEYPKLLRGDMAEKAHEIAKHTFTLDEFLYREFSAGRLGPEDFGPETVDLVLHVHCHEKALGDASKCAAALSLPANFNVKLLDSGCCGMAGSFGYEAEHYELSKTIAEESLLRHLRDLSKETVVVAAGTSCRHQVKDLLSVRALSTAEVLLRSWSA